VACIRSHTFKSMPTIGDVRKHFEISKSDAAAEEAARKWDSVLDYVRFHYHPDLSVRSGPRIVERTRRAINAAGGLAHIANCDSKSLAWARQRFMERFIRWSGLEEVQFLLPPGEMKNLLADVARAKDASQPERDT
jgi:hypothetical protein